MPAFVIQLHLHQHVAGEKFAFTAAFLTIAHLDHFFSRHQDLPKAVLHAQAIHTLFQRATHLLLEA